MKFNSERLYICLMYIDESGLTPEIKEEKFREALQEVYIELQKL